MTAAARTASAVALCFAVFTLSVETQQRGGTAQTDKVQPVNSGANPYRVTRDWARLDIEARPWGGSNGVAIDRDGMSVWATDRCSPGTTPGCLGTKANPVHHFDESGKEIRSFGGGMFVWPHGIHVDRDGNVWVTDARAPSADDLKKFSGEENKGSVVIKFSPEGKVLLTLGKPGVRGNPPDALTDPTDIVTDPRTGDVYVAESHTDVADANLVARISVFDRSGKFLRVIGKTGTAPGEFRTPHALELDSQGRLVVADRHNHRIQILSKDGKFIAEYDDFGRTSGLAIDGNDTIYTADSESTERVHPGWQRGIRIGSLKDGKVTNFVPPHMTPNSVDGAMGEGIAVDAAGNVYTAEAQLRGVTKYVREVATQAAPLWLDRPMASWNQPATTVPPVKTGVESRSALERRCGSSSLTASPTAEAVRKAGWTPFLHFDRAIARDAIEVIGGMTAAATPGCEPSMFNLFVFVGGTFAGTISPIVMGQGRDGIVGAVRVTAPDMLTAEFARYTTKDTECCPSSRVRVTYRIDRATSQPTLVPADIRTLR